MKIIDSKGKLFGKINIIDFLVFIFLFCLLPTVVFIWKIASGKPKMLTPLDTNEITLNSNFIKVRPEVLEQIKVGDKEIDGNGNIIGEIIWLGESFPYVYEFDIGDGSKSLKEISDLKNVPVTLKLKVESENNKLYYRSQRILIDTPLGFSTLKYSLKAVPVTGHRLIQNLNFNIVLKNIDDKTIDLVAAGDKELDQNGAIIAEILDIGKIENNTYQIDLGGGNVVLGEDNSGNKQVYANMRLKCDIIDNKIFFKEKSMTYNSPFQFKTDKYTLTAVLGKNYLKYVWLKSRVKFKEVIPEIYKLIKEEDVQKDTEGNVIVKIEKILANSPSPIATIKEDRYIEVPHPFMKDVVLLLDMLCLNKDGLLYLGNYPIKIGNTITFATDTYSLLGTIVGVEIP